MARPDGVEPPTARFGVLQSKHPILLFCLLNIDYIRPIEISYLTLICLHLKLFGEIYWTTGMADSPAAY